MTSLNCILLCLLRVTGLRSVMTGSYNNIFRVFNRESNQDIALEASRDNISTATHVLDPINFISGALCALFG